MTDIALSVQNLDKSFGGHRVTNDVSFTVKRGEIVCLVGPNGAGKTTIFNLITGFTKPDRGQVFVDQKEITGLSPHRMIHHGVARTFQNLRLFNELSVFENVYLGNPGIGERFWQSFFSTKKSAMNREAIEATENMLREYDLLAVKDEPVAKLPYGQQKLVSLVRGLIGKPSLLLLDEGTSGIDPHVLVGMMEHIQALPDRGVTVLMIEHNMDVVRELADKLIFLHHGQMLVQGSPDEIVQNQELTAIYFGDMEEVTVNARG